MAKMALCYGSEYQLLRFLGHHRKELNQLICDSVKCNGEISWLDYPYDKHRISGDGECKGISCFEGRIKNFHTIQRLWKQFWPSNGNSMNWDGIFLMNGIWHFVEAKATVKEVYQECGAKATNSIQMIDTAFSQTKQWLGISNDILWRDTKCYQLANRLAFLFFCNILCKIPARLLYVEFINGYPRKDVSSRSQWEQIWDEELMILGITENQVKDYLFHIYPDCNR